MAGLSSLMTAVSGLRAAQTGLNTVGHNISNVDTRGYVRQQVLQADFYSMNIGTNATSIMQVGLGTDISAVRQIRDRFLDISYREQACKAGFYGVKYTTGVEMETIIGEMEGQYKFQDVLSDMWSSLNYLSIDPTGIETRGMFIATASTFINKVNDIYNRTYEYQRNLNEQIKETVSEINNLVIKIDKMNQLIADAEIAGDNANDYRDTRNYCLDELSKIMKITVKNRTDGTVDILTENGQDLLVNGVRSNIGLRYSSEKWDFVEPVFTDSLEILDYDAGDTKTRPLFNFNTDVSSAKDNDNGKLKGLLISRGLEPANYTMSPGQYTPGTPEYFNVTNCVIPKLQMELDTMVHAIVTLINDTFSPYIPDGLGGYMQDPNAPYGLDGSQHVEIFTRIPNAYSQRFDSTGKLIEEDPSERNSLYTIGNIQINPLLLSASGYNLIAVSKSGDVSDNRTVIEDLLDKWRGAFIGLDNDEKLSVDGFYKKLISELAQTTNESKKIAETQEELSIGIDNKRKTISGVSMDEEMKSMLVYQHAYNASARVVNIIDGMLEKIINGVGRVGL